MSKHVLAILGTFVGIALIAGAPVHTLIPHTHSHSQSGGESVTWQALHSSLRHEDKKAVPFFMVLAVVGVAMFVRTSSYRTSVVLFIAADIELLRRGIAPHRAFG